MGKKRMNDVSLDDTKIVSLAVAKELKKVYAPRLSRPPKSVDVPDPQDDDNFDRDMRQLLADLERANRDPTG